MRLCASASVRPMTQPQQVRPDAARGHPAHHAGVDRRAGPRRPPVCARRRCHVMPLPRHRTHRRRHRMRPRRSGASGLRHRPPYGPPFRSVSRRGVPGHGPPLPRRRVPLRLSPCGRHVHQPFTRRPLSGQQQWRGPGRGDRASARCGPGVGRGTVGGKGHTAADSQEDGRRCDEAKEERAHAFTVSEARVLSKRRAGRPRGRRTDTNSRGSPGPMVRARAARRVQPSVTAAHTDNCPHVHNCPHVASRSHGQ